MRFENNTTFLTPPEANFVEEVCRYRANDTAMAARDVVRAGTLDWALSVVPKTFADHFQGSHIAYIILKSQALSYWEPKLGEVIQARFTPSQLESIRRLAQIGVRTATRKASAVDAETEHLDFLADLYDPENAGRYALSERDEATYRNQQFESYLEAISVGETIVAGITDHLN